MGRSFGSCRAHHSTLLRSTEPGISRGVPSTVLFAILVISYRSSCYNHPLMFSARKLARLLLLIALLVPSGVLLSLDQSDDSSKDGSSKSHAPQKQHDGSDLDDATVISALQQALEISSAKAIAQTGKHDGFLQNEAIRILLPPKLQAIGKSMRMLGRGDEVDELEIGMNRAAEDATQQAKPIFLSALKNLVFRDPQLVLTEGDTAATEYFRRWSSNDLEATFAPIVHHSMERLGVIKQYKHVLKNDPGGNAIASEFDLDKYEVEQTLDGIFDVIAAEEGNIRRDPPAQSTDLLKEVFGRK